MKTTVNNNNIESKNGMSQVMIDMRPKTRMYEGHGRETLTEVYYRVDVTAYTANLYTYTEQAREESEKACEAYYSEVVALLEAEGWERQNDKYDDCPTMTKGTQHLRCHPQEIVGNVLGEDVERLAEKLKGMTSCKWRGVDVYSNCVITTSAEDTMQLYRQTWDCEIMDIMADMFRTKRTTMYYKLEARLHNVADRIRIKINDWRNGKVDYEHNEDVRDFDGVRLGCDYVVNVYLREWARRAISDGRLIVAENADGIKIARWVNKKEEKELAKAIRKVEDIKVGDRVKVKSQDTPADVTAISEDGKYFTVKFVRPVRGFWTDNTMQTATYSRYGITRNYDRMTGEEIVGNAQYYAEQLKYGPGSIHEYEFAGVALRTESTRKDVEPDSREGWGNEYRVTIHHQTGDTTETMTLSETAELLARMYHEDQDKAA